MSDSLAPGLEPIVAPATPWGRSALAVVRFSGTDLRSLLGQICRPVGGFPPARRARLCRLYDEHGSFDEGLLTFFPGPRSYTGEDVAEVSCHGNPLVVERLLGAAVSAGARMARPGEFTRRAYLNGRLDLTRAEAVLQAISAASPAALKVARDGQDGRVARLVAHLREELIESLAELEARLDHPAEDLTYEDDATLARRLEELCGQAAAAAASFKVGRVLVEGARVALVGPVNAGKSSLFNTLGGSTRALVSPTPGTTRDVLERSVVLRGVAVTLLDTAGERETPDALERAGMVLGRELVADADLFLVVVPAHRADDAAAVLERVGSRPHLLIGNHADRPGAVEHWRGQPLLMTTASTGEGVEVLGEALVDALVGEEPGEARLVIASQRQRDLFLSVARATKDSRSALLGPAGVAVAAEELYAALEGLDAIEGRDMREAVLDALFARFCIGK